jgi:cytidylate kinase
MTLVTLSAAYGAGGSQVGPLVGERLGVPFVDRAIPTSVAERLDVSEREALDRDEKVGSWLSRALLSFGQMGPVLGGAVVPPVRVCDDDDFRAATEQVLREHAAGAGAVILGRAAAVVLRDEPRALHVRLTGAREARIEQGMRVEGVDRATAERHLGQTDHAREAYVRHYYRVEAGDPSLYHMVLDSTALPLDACADLVVAAAEARIDLKRLHEAVGAAGRLSFGSAELLREALGVEPGSVTPFAAINDRNGRVSVVLDASLMAFKRVNFHPLVNSMTTTIAREDLIRFLQATGHEPRVMALPEPTETRLSETGWSTDGAASP